ncbi:MAG: hypothetical protein M1820_006083 [Bogoriella megaspora]|nr:MAG: hypothetical protein M1820_006083 [Bogoriella megaspora]
MHPDAVGTAIRNGNDRPILSVPSPYKPYTTINQTPPTPPHSHDPLVLPTEPLFNNKGTGAAVLLTVASGPATPPQVDSFQSRMAHNQPPNRSQSTTPPLPWQRIPPEYRPPYWPEADQAPPHPHRLPHPATYPPPTHTAPTSAPRQTLIPLVNEPEESSRTIYHHGSQSMSAFQLQQQHQQRQPQQQQQPSSQHPQLHLLNPHYASLSDLKDRKPASIQSRRPQRLRSMLRLAPEPQQDLRSKIVHPHFDPNEPVEIIPPRSAPPQLSQTPRSQPNTPPSNLRERAASGPDTGRGREDVARISPASPPIRSSSMRERGWDEGREAVDDDQDQRMEDVEEDEFELALFAEATSGMGPLGLADLVESPNQPRSSRRISAMRHSNSVPIGRDLVSPISPTGSRDSGRAAARAAAMREREARLEARLEQDREQRREREHRSHHHREHRRHPSNSSLAPSLAPSTMDLPNTSRRSWEAFLEPDPSPNFAASGPGREADVLADELPSYGQSQMEASQKNRQEAARRAAELQRRWEESFRRRA